MPLDRSPYKPRHGQPVSFIRGFSLVPAPAFCLPRRSSYFSEVLEPDDDEGAAGEIGVTVNFVPEHGYVKELPTNEDGLVWDELEPDV